MNGGLHGRANFCETLSAGTLPLGRSTELGDHTATKLWRRSCGNLITRLFECIQQPDALVCRQPEPNPCRRNGNGMELEPAIGGFSIRLFDTASEAGDRCPPPIVPFLLTTALAQAAVDAGCSSLAYAVSALPCWTEKEGRGRVCFAPVGKSRGMAGASQLALAYIIQLQHSGRAVIGAGTADRILQEWTTNVSNGPAAASRRRGA